uniref:Baculoviral IAP repeat-containing protein 7-A n=1 Tax=Rhizophora mucronata TaxID=61149 RepID=A0A2P2Q428_RHIMU
MERITISNFHLFSLYIYSSPIWVLMVGLFIT